MDAMSRVSLAIATTVLLVGGVFVLRTAAPTESIEAVSSAQLAASERPLESVSVVTELVTAQTITAARVPAVAAHSTWRVRPAPPQKRSLLARVLLGDGEPRPQPFPRPARVR
jgi:hypothetical protein